MYVLCAGMYRACSTWQYEVITHLLERYRAAQRLGYLTGEEFAAQYDPQARAGAWRVLKSHEGDRSFARAIADGQAVTVYAHRDLRDVVFSLMHKRGLTFEQLLRQGMIHQILVNDRFWSTQPGVLTQRYEDLIADPVTGVLQLAAHLGLEISADEAGEVATEYSFQTNRRRTLELVEHLKAQGIDLSNPSNLQYYDQRTLLHWNHLREGRPGNWRTSATPAQRAVLARLCDDWLVAHGYEADTLHPDSPRPTAAELARRELELARGWTACLMRCAALRYPKSARVVKRVLGITTETTAAVPARTASAQVRVDSPQPTGLPASSGRDAGFDGRRAPSLVARLETHVDGA
jgi:hypothetical protein